MEFNKVNGKANECAKQRAELEAQQKESLESHTKQNAITYVILYLRWKTMTNLAIDDLKPR